MSQKSKVKEQGKLNMHIIFESVLILFTQNYYYFILLVCAC